MRLRSHLLIAALLFFVGSFVVQYYGAGGGAQQLDTGDPRVVSSLEYLSKDSVTRTIASSASSGELIKAWRSPLASGYKVNIATRFSKENWLATVIFDEDGRPLSGTVNLWSGAIFPLYLRMMAAALVCAWTFGLIAAHLWRVTCPHCFPSFWSPPVCDIEESCVFPGGFDESGYSLLPIVRRDYVCQHCGYRKTMFFSPGEYRGGVIFPGLARASAGLLNPKEDEWYTRVVEKWFTSRTSQIRFRTHHEWKAFYDELKASEREEMPGQSERK